MAIVIKMKNLPLEIINYCLYLANTGTKIVYNPLLKIHQTRFDFDHSKYHDIQRLHLYRHVEYTRDNSLSLTLVSLPNLVLKINTDYELYYNGIISIIEYKSREPYISWYPSIIKKKTPADNTNISYSIETTPTYML